MPRIRDVLRDPKAYGLRYALYARKPVLSDGAECLLLDPDDEDDAGATGDDVPPAARAAGYGYVLLMDDVNGIVANLLQQTERPTDELRFEALQHYLTRDAYLAL